MSSEAFVTLATNDGYGLGALVLAQSIRQVGTKRNLVVLISNHLSDLIRKTLEENFDEVIVVDELNSNDIEHLNLLSRPELGITFTKINCWLLEQYTKCVFLDADCVVLRSIDQLFDREELSAAPDAGWPDCFNSGVFVYRPSKDTFTKLMLFASQNNASFDGGDQGLLNAFFSNWGSADISRHLPFTYNVTANAFYSYLPAVTRFRNDIHIVHFAGALKPWQLTFNPQNEQLSGNLGGQSEIQRDFLLSWWRIMHQRVWPNINQLNQQLNPNDKTISGEGQFGSSFVSSLNYGNLTDNKGVEVGSAAHRRAWEAGQIDYFGRDSFSNIQQQLERNIQQISYEYHPSQQRQITPEKTTNNKTSIKETTPTIQQQTTTTKSTTVVNTSLKETTILPQQTTFISQNLPKQPPTTTIISQNVTELPTTTTVTATNASQNLSKQTTTLPVTKTTTNVSQNLPKEPTPLPTNILKSSLKETTTNNASQSVLKEPTPLSTKTLQSSSKEATNNVSQNLPKQSAPLSTNTLKSSLKETTTNNASQTVLKETTPLPTNTLQSSSKETTNNVSQNLPKQSTPLPTNILKSSLKETTTNNASQSVLKEPTPLSTNTLQSSSKEATNNTSPSVLKETTPLSTSTLKSSLKDSTQPLEQSTTSKVSQNVSKGSTASSNNSVKSSLEESTTKVSQTVLKESTPLSTNLFKSSLKEATTPHTQRENTQTLVGSIRSNENKTPPSVEHESNWTVKSTIVTSYTQGAGDFTGPTVVSKAVSETSATSASDSPIKTSIKQMPDLTKPSGLNLTAKTSIDRFTWLSDKIFVAITYTISLCYLLFLVAIRRSKNTNIIHGNGTSVRGVASSANNGNRVNK